MPSTTLLLQNNACSIAPLGCFLWSPGTSLRRAATTSRATRPATLPSPAGGGRRQRARDRRRRFQLRRTCRPVTSTCRPTSVAINGESASRALMARDRHRRPDAVGHVGRRGGRVRGDDGGVADVVRGVAVGDGAVDLLWRTGSEVDNLGFHVYRSLSAGGPWTRLTSSLIPGQGFSAMGAAYAWRDSRPARTVRATSTVSRTWTRSPSRPSTARSPLCPGGSPTPAPPEGGGSGGSSGSGSGGRALSSCPSWALAQLGSSASYTCETHGDPAATSFRVLSRSSRSGSRRARDRGLPHRTRRHGPRPGPPPRLRLALRPAGAGAALEARPPRRRRRPPGPHRLHPGSRQPLLLRTRRRRRRIPPGRRRSRRHRATGPPGSRASPLPRCIPSRPGPTRAARASRVRTRPSPSS